MPKQKGGRAGCLYDWGGFALLRCTTCASKHTVVRWPSLGHDLLEEFYSKGMLVGEALADAERLFRQREGEEWLCEF